MTSIIFRLLAWGGFFGLGVMFFINQKSFVSLDKEVAEAEKLKKEATYNLEIDENKSSDLINGLFRERGKLRLEIEESATKAGDFKEEGEMILLKEKDLIEKSAKLGKELIAIRADLVEAQKKTAEKVEQGAPVREQTKEVLEEVKQLEEESKKVKSERDELNAELSALRTRRDVAKRTYNEERERLLSEIERPPYHYFGDEVEIDVLSVSPSGAGLFFEEGYKSGFRDDFKYLAYEQNEPDRYFYLQASLVQKGLTFLEFMGDFRENASDFIRSEQKLFLIRTGDSNTTLP